jgi:CheY-like chemotaxis protein
MTNNDPMVVFSVFIVDDDPSVVDLLTVLFGRHREFKVRGSARSAEDALATVGQVDVDLIVVDHRLAGALTGTDAAAALKAAAGNAKVMLLATNAQAVADRSPALDAVVDKDDFRMVVDVARSLVGMRVEGPAFRCPSCSAGIPLTEVELDNDTGRRSATCTSCRSTWEWSLGDMPHRVS